MSRIVVMFAKFSCPNVYILQFNVYEAVNEQVEQAIERVLSGNSFEKKLEITSFLFSFPYNSHFIKVFAPYRSS